MPRASAARAVLLPWWAGALLAVLCVLPGCVGHGIGGPTAAQERVQQLRDAGFVPMRHATGGFMLYGLLRPARGDRAGRLHVYIEGDGYAWKNTHTPSGDPTPHNDVTLRLAAADPTACAVLYLARPCQYTRDLSPACATKYWTNARFAPEVISVTNAAIDRAKAQTGAQHVVLVGFSGGGAVAVLAAALRDDVAFLGTVAGNLDHAAWTRLHRLTPLAASLNPRDAAPRVRLLPQRHLSSPGDRIMPPGISAGFCEAVGQPNACVQAPGVPHGGPWEEAWNYAYGP